MLLLLVAQFIQPFGMSDHSRIDQHFDNLLLDLITFSIHIHDMFLQ